MNGKFMLAEDTEILSMLLLQSPVDEDKRGQLPEVTEMRQHLACQKSFFIYLYSIRAEGGSVQK